MRKAAGFVRGRDLHGQDEREGVAKVKICGLCRPEDAAHAVAAGATHVGVVLVPGSRRGQEVERAAEIYAAATGAVRVGVFADEDPDRLVELGEVLGLDVLQLHGDESPGTARRVRDGGPWAVWKAIRPRNRAEYDAGVISFAAAADGVLVDGFSAGARGGTGARAPWSELAGAGEAVPEGLILILAGGLTPANVAEAVARVRPALVDVSSGVESELCRKDPGRVERFIVAARQATDAVT